MDQSKTIETDNSEILKRESSSSSSEEEEVQSDQTEEWENNLIKNKYLFNFKKWPVFLLLEDELLLQIKLAMIYDNGALIVLKNDIVYAIGNNMYNRLAIAQENNTFENIKSPTKVEILCEKNIKKFAIGVYMFALTKTGQIYYWDYNKKPVLRDGKESKYVKRIDTPTLLIELEDPHYRYVTRCITDIACSDICLLVLTDIGKVYFWTFTSYSTDHASSSLLKTYLDKPEQMHFAEKIVSIACGYLFNMAITDTGKLYGWLQQDFRDTSGQNVENEEFLIHLIPRRIPELSNEVIAKVVCGRNHALALTNEGKLYVLNIEVQLDSTDLFSSVLMNIPQINKVLDIASVYHSNRKVVLGDDDNVYVWGNYFSQEITDPIVTYFSNVHEALMYNITDKYPIVLFMDDLQYINVESDILESLQSLFNDSLTSDIEITVEGKSIYAHKTILKCRSEHYYGRMFKYDWQESTKKAIDESKSFSYIVRKTFLKYLYTGTINYLPMKQLLELLRLAYFYCDSNLVEYVIQEIKRKPREIIKQNVDDLYEVAKQHDIKALQTFCLES